MAQIRIVSLFVAPKKGVGDEEDEDEEDAQNIFLCNFQAGFRKMKGDRLDCVQKNANIFGKIHKILLSVLFPSFSKFLIPTFNLDIYSKIGKIQDRRRSNENIFL